MIVIGYFSLIFAITTNYSKDRCTLSLFNQGNYKMIKQLEQNEIKFKCCFEDNAHDTSTSYGRCFDTPYNET